jgi:2-methylcitrate dehydratase PrpD
MHESQRPELTEVISDYIAGLDESNIPSEVFEHSKTAFLDWLGCVIGGHKNPIVKKVIDYSELMGGHEQASIICSKRRANVLHAASINGAAAHILGYDDTSKIYIGHSSAVLFPGLLSLSEWKEIPGVAFLTAHIAAFKVASVLGSIVGMKSYQKGWWTTTTVGGVAAAAGCSRILGLNGTQTRAALGIASNAVSGLKSVFGSEAKAFHAGYTSGIGIQSALLASENLTCSDRMLEGVDGYVQVFDGELDNDAQKLFGEIWEFDELAQKYHSSCHFSHSPIEAVLRLVEEEGLSPQEIRKINVEISELALKAAGKTRIESILDAKFSVSYCISNAILRKNTGLYAFTDELIRNKNVLDFMDKVHVRSNNLFKPMEAKVSIERNDGTTVSQLVDVFNEVPKINVKKERIKKKFTDICAPLISSESIGNIISDVANLEKISNIRVLIDNVNNIFASESA